MKDKKEQTTFELLSAINVNDKAEKKQNLTYLSWAWAWSEFKKNCPDATYEISKYGEDGNKVPYIYDADLGLMVDTTVTVNGETLSMWLPVMDGANKSMKKVPYNYKTKYGEKHCASATMFDINKTIMRCLVKNLAMFGLGIYIYAGEDLPEAVEEIVPEVKVMTPLKKGDENWDKVTKFVEMQFSKGVSSADTLLTLKTKYTMSKSVEVLITKIMS